MQDFESARYELVEAEPFFCVPACISMILAVTGIIVSQKEIVNYFTLRLPTDYTQSSHTKVSYTENTLELGISVDESTVQGMLKDVKSKLQVSLSLVSQMMDWQFEEVVGEFDENKHVVVLLDYGQFRYKSASGTGHAVLIHRKVSTDYVAVMDPGPNPVEETKISLPDLRAAALSRHDGALLVFYTPALIQGEKYGAD